MSLLPQRKKSAEEIAKLRETLGIPGAQAGEETSSPEPAEKIPEPPASVSPEKSEKVFPEKKAIPKPPITEVLPPIAPLPLDEEPLVKLEVLPEKSEAIPVLPLDGVAELERASPSLEKEAIPLPTLQVSKTVRSLRKSEQGPVSVQPPNPDSKLPVNRRSDQELNQIRRRDALAKVSVQAAPPRSLAAHPVLISPGYVLAVAAAACFYYYELSIAITGACVGAAILFAVVIFFRWPLSRHHAAFIAVISLFVIVFGTLYYFPNLRHGS